MARERILLAGYTNMDANLVDRGKVARHTLPLTSGGESPIRVGTRDLEEDSASAGTLQSRIAWGTLMAGAAFVDAAEFGKLDPEMEESVADFLAVGVVGYMETVVEFLKAVEGLTSSTS